MLAGLLDDPITLRVLVVAPHPDDETIGAGIALGRMRRAEVLHLTDGAPRERRFWTAACDTREAYAAVRRAEALAALALAGIAPRHVHALGLADQALSDDLVGLAGRVAAILDARPPDVLVTTPYEGAHPDHDAAAFACRAAVDRATGADRARPALVEMTSYHLYAGALRSGRFLDDSGDRVTIVPTPAERVRKQQMLAAYASQQDMLGHFPVRDEAFRPAPKYDFTAPPHAGPLFYETIGMPGSGQEWRARAARALDVLRAAGGPGPCAS